MRTTTRCHRQRSEEDEHFLSKYLIVTHSTRQARPNRDVTSEIRSRRGESSQNLTLHQPPRRPGTCPSLFCRLAQCGPRTCMPRCLNKPQDLRQHAENVRAGKLHCAWPRLGASKLHHRRSLAGRSKGHGLGEIYCGQVPLPWVVQTACLSYSGVSHSSYSSSWQLEQASWPSCLCWHSILSPKDGMAGHGALSPGALPGDRTPAAPWHQQATA